MRATVWGSRGTIAAPGPDTVRYGGETSCVAIDLADGSLLILDAGTGIRAFGTALGREHPRRIDLLISHLHTDHIEGLRFFQPFWEASVEFHIWGPPSPIRTLQQRIAPFFAPPFFPVHLRDVPSRPRFHEAGARTWTIGSATVSAAMIKHPGPSVGYRIEDGDRTIAYLPDHEPALGADLDTIGPEWVSGLGLAREADLLLHDAQYTRDEYEARLGWGHSTTEHAVTFARRSGARRLVLFHHDPTHTDEDLDRMLAEGRSLAEGTSTAVDLAAEGKVYALR
jgi:phosphoribosyl 1,2-cyclic phosphodiesterase